MIYIPKVTSVDAFQYDGDFKGAYDNLYLPNWARVAFDMNIIYYDKDDFSQLFVITGNKSEIHVPVNVGDYIIKTLGNLIVIPRYIFESLFYREECRNAK